jgi:hypothetical protein
LEPPPWDRPAQQAREEGAASIATPSHGSSVADESAVGEVHAESATPPPPSGDPRAVAGCMIEWRGVRCTKQHGHQDDHAFHVIAELASADPAPSPRKPQGARQRANELLRPAELNMVDGEGGQWWEDLRGRLISNEEAWAARLAGVERERDGWRAAYNHASYARDVRLAERDAATARATRAEAELAQERTTSATWETILSGERENHARVCADLLAARALCREAVGLMRGVPCHRVPSDPANPCAWCLFLARPEVAALAEEKTGGGG